MTLQEFKAWFEGFTEDMDGRPTEKQWKRIQKRIKEIDGTVTTERVFIDRWIRPYAPYWQQWQIWNGAPTSVGGGTITNQIPHTSNSAVTANALMDAGRAEFKAVA